MSELRWVLLVAGLLILALVFWLSSRETSGRKVMPMPLLRRRLPGLTATGLAASAEEAGPVIATAGIPGAISAQRIVTVRLMARSERAFAGDELILACAKPASGMDDLESFIANMRPMRTRSCSAWRAWSNRGLLI